LKVHATDIDGVYIVEPDVRADERGFFLETWNARAFEAAGLPAQWVQDNHSRSGRGVVRGLHYQLEVPQGKLVRVSSGRIFDVAVDLRRSSPTFGRWTACELSDRNQLMVWIPPGFAHGFLSLEDDTDVIYKCTGFYDPAAERAIAWDDAELGIKWPEIPRPEIQVSAKDASAPSFGEADLFP
jgi:dTDP-4-dehydrorhamnose 3,5-epimerase